MDNKTKLLQDVLRLFSNFGVRSGVGVDGKLMADIEAELASDPSNPPRLTSFNPALSMQCPLCQHPDFNECGCPADQQMAAMV